MFRHLRLVVMLCISFVAFSPTSNNAQQLVGISPQGPVCNGPMGLGLCAQVFMFLQQHPGSAVTPPGVPIVIGLGPNGPMCTGPAGPGPCSDVFVFIQQHTAPAIPGPSGQPIPSQAQTYSAIGQQAQQIGVQCATQSQGDLNSFVSCAGGQVILPRDQQMLVDCAARAGSTVADFATCMGGTAILNQLKPEQQIALECVSETGGQPYAAAGCTATRLTLRELGKCVTDGIGGDNGCFGNNNDLVGQNGWTARNFNNVVHDIQNGPGPNNDLVGANGVVVRTVTNIQHDIQKGPGPNNDVVGCNGWANKNLFHGHC